MLASGQQAGGTHPTGMHSCSHCMEQEQDRYREEGLAQWETMGPGPCPCLRPV